MTDRPFHPDRRATTLAQRDASVTGDDFAPPGPDSEDARVDWKLLRARAHRALEVRGTDAARTRLAALDASVDLLAGTVQDGCIRGATVAYEEAESLCSAAIEPPPRRDDELLEVYEGKELRRRREFVIRSGGAHVRFSRKLGVTLVDRSHDVVATDCMRFDDRDGTGDLDEFEITQDRRARVFAPNFLKAARFEQSKSTSRLVLRGRLGRRPTGFDCEIRFEGRADESRIRMDVLVRNEQDDHRLRIRFATGVESCVHHAGTPAWQRVHASGRSFLCGTLVRACARLRLDDNEVIATPDARCIGWVHHTFELGGDTKASSRPDAHAWLAPLQV